MDYLRGELTDGGEETMILKPKRNPAVRCSAWLGALPELAEWLNQLKRFGGEVTVEATSVKLRTTRYIYSITAHKDGRGYLGCIANARVPREGETWLRGRDLADGVYSPETWQSILTDIVAYELEMPV